jgi:hypothetical protein
MMGLDDETFAVVAVGAFMQICGFLQMPQLLGPSFSPFTALIALPGQLMQKMPKAEVNLLPEGTPSAYKAKVESNGDGAVHGQPAVPQKKKRRRNKKKEL